MFKSLYFFTTPSQSVKPLSKTLKVGNFGRNVTSLVVSFHFLAIPGELDPDIKQACTLQANMLGLAEDLNLKDGPAGQYFVVKYKVVIKSDSTKLEAFLQWDEKVRVYMCDLIMSTNRRCRVSQNAGLQLLFRLNSFQAVKLVRPRAR